MTEIRKTIELVKNEKFKEAFEYGYTHGVCVSEDWIEEDGTEYYQIMVEDDVFKFKMDD